MIEVIKYRWQLRKLNRKYNKLSRFHHKKIEKAQSSTEREELRADAGAEISPILEEMDSLKTKRFCQLANKVLVPIPDRSKKEMWIDKYYDYGSILTDKGIWEIKKLLTFALFIMRKPL